MVKYQHFYLIGLSYNLLMEHSNLEASAFRQLCTAVFHLRSQFLPLNSCWKFLLEIWGFPTIPLSVSLLLSCITQQPSKPSFLNKLTLTGTYKWPASDRGCHSPLVIEIASAHCLQFSTFLWLRTLVFICVHGCWSYVFSISSKKHRVPCFVQHVSQHNIP